MKMLAGPDGPASTSPARQQRSQLDPITPPQRHEGMLRTKPEFLSSIQEVGPAALDPLKPGMPSPSLFPLPRGAGTGQAELQLLRVAEK